MRIGFTFRSQIAQLSQALVNELDALYAALQQGWYAEHKGDGSHGAVTADTLQVGPVVLAGRYRLALAAGQTDNLVVPATTQVLALLPDLVGSTVSGLVMTGLTTGVCRTLAILNESLTTNLTLRLRVSGAGTTPNPYKFQGDLSLPNTDVQVLPGRWVWVLWDTPPDRAGGWHVHAF